MRWILSAMPRACASDSMTQGPAIRNSLPAPTSTGPIEKGCGGVLTGVFHHSGRLFRSWSLCSALRTTGQWTLALPGRYSGLRSAPGAKEGFLMRSISPRVTAALFFLPLLAFAAQQQPATPADLSSAAPRVAAAPQDPRAREADLGLTGPANPKLPSLILVGDSTVRNGHGKGSDGLWGWGAPIADLFDPDKINVVNRAIGGLSSHSYISGGHWDIDARDGQARRLRPDPVRPQRWRHQPSGRHSRPRPGPPPRAAPRPHPRRTRALAAPTARGSLPAVGEETLEVDNPSRIRPRPCIPSAGICASTLRT